MDNRVLIGNGKSSKLKTPTLPDTYAEFKVALEAGTQFVDVTPNDSLDTDPGVTAIGTALNKANLLSDATAQKLGLPTTAVPNDALNEIANALEVINTVQFQTSDWQAAEGGGYKAVKNVANITANSKPIPSIHFQSNIESGCKAEQKAMSKITKFVTGAGTITAYAYAVPSVSIYIDFRGI